MSANSVSFKMIVAYCKNRGIGYDNKIPWISKKDMRHFSKVTIGNKNNSKMSLHNLTDKNPEVINYAKDKPDIVKHLLSLHKSWAEDVSPKSND